MTPPLRPVRLAFLLLPALAPAWLTGCATAVDPRVPTVVTLERFSVPQAAAPGGPPTPAHGWQRFDDPVLDTLQQRLTLAAPTLAAAAARQAAAQAALGVQRAATRPTLNASLAATRSDSGQASLTRQPVNSLSLGPQASWEIDLWGRLAANVRAGEARLAASAADLAAARQSLRATLAQTYFTLRAAEARQQLLERGAAAYQRTVELTQARLETGVAPASDVLQARLQWQDAQVALLEARTQRAQALHAIGVLLGLAPDALAAELATHSAELPAVPRLPALLPAGVIQARPDIAAAEQRLIAARWTTENARTALFPGLTLSASGGLRGNALDELARSPTLFWSIGPALVQKVFDGGATRSAIEQARAGEDEALATYRLTVLAALQEVQDNLVLAAHLADEATLQAQSVRDAQRTLEIVQAQYEAGTVSFLNVATAQVNALNARQKQIDLELRRLLASVTLLRNVGGEAA